MSEKQKEIITWIVIIAVIYFAYRILKGFFGAFTPPEGTIPDAQSQSTVQINTSNLTWPLNSFEGFADQIYQSVWGGFDITENDQTFGEILSEMNTDDDVAQLIKTYGIRGEGVLIQKYYNLPQTVTEYLDNDIRNSVNKIYQSKGIKFQW